MTCERLQCKRSYLFFEPAVCPECDGMNFKRNQPYGEDAIYTCDDCDKQISIGRKKQIEFLPMNEPVIEEN